MSGKKIKPEEKKGTAAAARSSDDDSYENHGRGLNVVLTPVQAPKLRSTEKNEVFNFLKKYDQYLEILHDRRLAGERILPVELIRCLAPSLYELLKDYVLKDTKVEVKHQVMRGHYSSEEIRAYLDSLIFNSKETITVDDVLRGISWNLKIVDPKARVINVFKAGHERMLKHGLTPDSFCESLIKGMCNLIRPLPLRDEICTHLNLPANKELRKDRKLYFKMVLGKTITFEEFNIKSSAAASKDVKSKSKPVPVNYNVCNMSAQQRQHHRSCKIMGDGDCDYV